MTDTSKLIEAVKAAVAEGEAIITKAQRDYKFAPSADDDDGPRIPFKSARAVRAEALAGPYQSTYDVFTETIPVTIQNIVNYAQAGRSVAAGWGLAKLREDYEKVEPRDMPADEMSWAAFARKRVPLPTEQLNQLLGNLAFSGGRLQCVKCDTLTICRCGCGEPYVNEHRWAESESEPVTKGETKVSIGRPPISEKAMTGAERLRKYRERKRNSAPFASVAEARSSDKIAFMNRIDTAWRLIDVYDGSLPEHLDQDMRELAEATAAKAAALVQQLRERPS
jgi:hypothetical protein